MHRILVIGAGSIGERHIRCFQRTGRAIVSVCEIDDVLRTTIVERYGLSAGYAGLDDALAQPFDAAVVCTPAHLHIRMALQLVDHGVALLIEKPLSTSLADIDVLIDRVSQTNLPSGVAYVLRHHPALTEMRTVLREGQFGRPVQLTYQGGQHFPFYRPAYREIYYARHETGGGAIQDALTHMVNAAEWLVGPVTRLIADAEHCVLPGVTVEDTVHLLTRHGELPGSFVLNQHQPVNESTLTVHCETGSVRMESHRNRLLVSSEPGGDWVEQQTYELERDDLFVRQADSFLDLLEGVHEPACTLAEAAQTLRVNLAALESVQSQARVTI